MKREDNGFPARTRHVEGDTYRSLIYAVCMLDAYRKWSWCW